MKALFVDLLGVEPELLDDAVEKPAVGVLVVLEADDLEQPALADLIGLDVCLHVMETLYQGFEDPKYRPCPLLKQMVDAGYLGRKTGRGFFEYG